MRIFARIGLVVMLVLLGVGHPVAQTATLSGDLLTDWRQQKRMMMGIAEAMPEETLHGLTSSLRLRITKYREFASA